MIVQEANLLQIRDRFPGSAIGYTSGVFDLLHQGHVTYLEKCRQNCDLLVVGIDADNLVVSRKGTARPVQSLDFRLLNVQCHADYVFPKEKSSKNYTAQLKPNVYFFSEQNFPDSIKIKEISSTKNFLRVIIVEYSEGISTTSIIENGRG